MLDSLCLAALLREGRWVSPKPALSVPDERATILLVSECAQWALERGLVLPAKMPIGLPNRLSVCHPLLSPYALAQMPGPYVSVCDGVFVCVCLITEEYNTSIQEKLPLIIGSAAAGLVFLIAVVVIVIVCNR